MKVSLRNVVILGTLFLITTPSRIWSAGPPDDSIISFWVSEALREDTRVDSSRIRAKSETGIVRLTGIVPNLSSRRYAVLEAKKIKGVRGVIDQIVVLTVARPDLDIRQDILRKFLNAPIINVSSVEPEVKDGNVTLKGSVMSWSQYREAGLLASEVRGVRSVKNKLKVVYEFKRPDDEIRQDILAALNRDVYLSGLPVTVTVKDGVATLKGSVANPYQRERASYDALFVDNVRNVENLIEVGWWEDKGVERTPPFPSNEDLNKNVRDELYVDLRIKDPYEIKVEAEHGYVTLRGVVPSHYQKRLAEKDAHDVVGVVGVTNLLTVNTDWREDSAVRDDIEFELAVDPVLSELRIAVNVKNAVVTLNGVVNTFDEKEHAADVVSRVLGVRDVINNIVVNKMARYSDVAIKKHVKARLESNDMTRWVAGQIEVNAKEGTVTLSGEVDDWAEYKEAARVTAFTEGVVGVVNRLKVIGAKYQWEES